MFFDKKGDFYFELDRSNKIIDWSSDVLYKAHCEVLRLCVLINSNTSQREQMLENLSLLEKEVGKQYFFGFHFTHWGAGFYKAEIDLKLCKTFEQWEDFKYYLREKCSLFDSKVGDSAISMANGSADLLECVYPFQNEDPEFGVIIETNIRIHRGEHLALITAGFFTSLSHKRENAVCSDVSVFAENNCVPHSMLE